MASLFAKHLLLFSVFNTISMSLGSPDSDVSCLMSFKESIEDPFGYLNSWNFSHAEVETGRVCLFTGIQCWHVDENKILSISLSDMNLKGEFPRGVVNCTSLTSLELSGNSFSGPLPSEIDRLIPFMTKLDLSRNNFSGEIPASIGNLSYINYLVLNNNQLAGNLPSSLGELPRLQYFSVANNLLVGPVPQFANTAIGRKSFENNAGLCSGPFEPCKKLRGGGKFLDVDDFLAGFSVGYCIFVTVVMTSVAFKGKLKLQRVRMESAISNFVRWN